MLGAESPDESRMPLYMDIHKLPDDVTPDMIQEAHVKDVAVQDEYGVCYQGYWFDQHGKTVACLVSGPDRETCEEVHRKAHGLMAEKIIEVSPEIVQAFMGGGQINPAGEARLVDGSYDTGVRVLVVTEIDNLAGLTNRLGDEAAARAVGAHDAVVRRLLPRFGGREARHMGDGMMLSFALASAAVSCALEIQKIFAAEAGQTSGGASIRIGISAGEPVSQRDSLFGAAVEQARTICRAARPGEVVVSTAVRDLCSGKGLAFGPAPLSRATGPDGSRLELAVALGAADGRQNVSGATPSVSSGAFASTQPVGRPDGALGDRYVVEKEIGSGGMATVYAARDLRHDRIVAVKVLREDLSASMGAARFLQEIRVGAKLTHPNIVSLYDSGESGGVLYYVMPYLEGETLRQVILRERQLAVSRAVEMARRIAAGLDHAHRQGIVHRDIKPENVMMQDGEPMILDFGIALALSQAGADRLTTPGRSLGTPAYMSPEQITGDREVDARTDVYAMGCLVYEMLAGDAPFTGNNIQSLMARILTDTPSRLGALRDVPRSVDEAVHRALAKVPADRFDSAGEFAAALAS